MKVRMGFVSNSSSSSFVVIGDGENLVSVELNEGRWEDLRDCGTTEFGWEVEYHRTVYDRVNFAYLQALYVNNTEWIEMLDQVIMEHTGATAVDSGFFRSEYGVEGGYIDHQSCSSDDENTEMFESKEVLKNFLFDKASYVKTQNDND